MTLSQSSQFFQQLTVHFDVRMNPLGNEKGHYGQYQTHADDEHGRAGLAEPKLDQPVVDVLLVGIAEGDAAGPTS